MPEEPGNVDPSVLTPIEMDIFRTVQYTLGISSSEIIAQCKAVQGD